MSDINQVISLGIGSPAAIQEFLTLGLQQGAPADTTPDAFTFTDQSGVNTSTTITSAPVTITGIDAAATITITGGTYDINGSGSFTSSAGTVNNGDTVRARHTSSANYNTATDTTVTVGGVSDTFTSTTRAQPAGGGSGTHRPRIGGIMVFN